MPKKPLIILAVNPGTRYLGFSAFRGPELLDWGVKVVSGKTRSRKLGSIQVILHDCLQLYAPDALAIKQLHPSRSSQGLNELVKQIKAFSRRRGLKVYQYSIQDIKDTLCPKMKTNKRKLAETLATMYPILAHDLHCEQENKNPYRIRMFEAVALGAVCYQQLEK
jgi:Holliday junction resolvasome RuvABC endonuclease subunit